MWHMSSTPPTRQSARTPLAPCSAAFPVRLCMDPSPSKYLCISGTALTKFCEKQGWTEKNGSLFVSNQEAVTSKNIVEKISLQSMLSTITLTLTHLYIRLDYLDGWRSVLMLCQLAARFLINFEPCEQAVAAVERFLR